MPLSEEELRMLEQMERALVQEDPKLASTLRGTAFRRQARRRAILGGAVFVLGVCLLMGGAISRIYLIGIAGFVVMLGGATLALAALNQKAAPKEPEQPEEESHGRQSGLGVVDGGKSGKSGKPSKKQQPRRTTASFMERMEERWKRRREGGGW